MDHMHIMEIEPSLKILIQTEYIKKLQNDTSIMPKQKKSDPYKMTLKQLCVQLFLQIMPANNQKLMIALELSDITIFTEKWNFCLS